MNTEMTTNLKNMEALAVPIASPLAVHVPAEMQDSLRRMFADPHLLEKEERVELVRGLRECVAAHPEVSPLRVLLGMALCVNFEVPDAIEEIREAVRLAPDSFIARLKMGELWMRLRVCEKAAEETRQAALLAQNAFQSELARRQAATLRTLMHNGIQRGGSQNSWSLMNRLRRLWNRRPEVASAALDLS